MTRRLSAVCAVCAVCAPTQVVAVWRGTSSLLQISATLAGISKRRENVPFMHHALVDLAAVSPEQTCRHADRQTGRRAHAPHVGGGAATKR